ncbi:hypothetical protein Bca4012_088502 [Brassica carinata]
MPQVKIIAKNFMDMVASLTAIKLDKLYNNVFICEAILRFSFVAHQFVKSFVRCHLLGCGRIRSLPPLAKKYVLQLLFIDDPVPCTRIEEWVLPDGLSKHRVAIDRLIQLRIFTETVVDSGVLPREPMNSNNGIKLPSLQELETYALLQWELMDTNAQLWYIIREYISNAEGRKDSWFIPTKLATNLSVSLADSSVRKEIITFLQQNSHPRCADRVPSIPENVTDQIRLWESDLKRIEMTQAHFYDEFPSKDVFEGACNFARQWGGLLWEDSKRMRLVVKSEVHNQMREYLHTQGK